MPGPKRSRRERTDEWASVKQWTLWEEQELYEQIRPIILFGQTPGERAKEIGATQRTLSRKADEFEKYGMQSLFVTFLRIFGSGPLLVINGRVCKTPFIVVREHGGHVDAAKEMPPDHTSSF